MFGHKVAFWISVVIAAIVGIYLFKAAAGAFGPQGLKEFAAAV
jgi:hypothetical protein